MAFRTDPWSQGPFNSKRPFKQKSFEPESFDEWLERTTRELAERSRARSRRLASTSDVPKKRAKARLVAKTNIKRGGLTGKTPPAYAVATTSRSAEHQIETAVTS